MATWGSDPQANTDVLRGIDRPAVGHEDFLVLTSNHQDVTVLTNVEYIKSSDQTVRVTDLIDAVNDIPDGVLYSRFDRPDYLWRVP